jgi:hypothetical protein
MPASCHASAGCTLLWSHLAGSVDEPGGVLCPQKTFWRIGRCDPSGAFCIAARSTLRLGEMSLVRLPSRAPRRVPSPQPAEQFVGARLSLRSGRTRFARMGLGLRLRLFHVDCSLKICQLSIPAVWRRHANPRQLSGSTDRSFLRLVWLSPTCFVILPRRTLAVSVAGRGHGRATRPPRPNGWSFCVLPAVV